MAVAGPDAVRSARRGKHSLMECILEAARISWKAHQVRGRLSKKALVGTRPQSISRSLSSGTTT